MPSTWHKLFVPLWFRLNSSYKRGAVAGPIGPRSQAWVGLGTTPEHTRIHQGISVSPQIFLEAMAALKPQNGINKSGTTAKSTPTPMPRNSIHSQAPVAEMSSAFSYTQLRISLMSSRILFDMIVRCWVFVGPVLVHFL